MSPAAHLLEVSETGHQMVSIAEDNSGSATCKHCEATKPLDEFAKDSSARNGRRSMCQECRTTYDQKQSYLKRIKAYRLEPVVESFTRSELVDRYDNCCYYCEGPFESIDHKKCVRVGGAHTLDNVVPCCLACNRWKRYRVDQRLIKTYRRIWGPTETT